MVESCDFADSDNAFVPSRANRLMGVTSNLLSVILAEFNSTGSRTSNRINESSDFNFSESSVTVISGIIRFLYLDLCLPLAKHRFGTLCPLRGYFLGSGHWQRLDIQPFHILFDHPAGGE